MSWFGALFKFNENNKIFKWLNKTLNRSKNRIHKQIYEGLFKL